MTEKFKELPLPILISILIGISLIIICLIIYKLKSKNKFPYKKVSSLLTETELKFYKILFPIIKKKYHISMKVRLEDIIQVSGKFNNKERWSHRGRIKSRHIDFVLCDKRTLEICHCIELDDKSHNRKDRIVRDKFVDWALKNSGISVIHIKTARTYSSNTLKNMFL